MRARAATLALAAVIGNAGGAEGQRVLVSPQASMDDVLDVRVVGLRPSQLVTIRATMPDSAGRSWSAEALYSADARGEVSPARDAPLSGSYAGLQPMGLVTSMDLPGRAGTSIFVPRDLGELPLTFTLIVEERVVDSATVLRHFVAQDVRRVELDASDGLIGTVFHPIRPGRKAGVLVLGGSEGGNSAADVAAQLAAHGYVTLALAYFGAGSLPGEIDEIPLEYFMRAISYLAQRDDVDSTAIALLGTSKGAEAALLVAAHDPRVRAVVAYAPSSVAWSCICSTAAHSSWSLGGKPVPAVPPGRDPSVVVVPGEPLRPAVHYRYRMRDEKLVAAAAIPVERINGPVMLVVGGADELWPSAEMALDIQARLASAVGRRRNAMALYPAAGHRIGKSYLPAGSTRIAGGRLETGGTPAANAAAQVDAWPRVLTFLSSSLRR